MNFYYRFSEVQPLLHGINNRLVQPLTKYIYMNNCWWYMLCMLFNIPVVLFIRQVHFHNYCRFDTQPSKFMEALMSSILSMSSSYIQDTKNLMIVIWTNDFKSAILHNSRLHGLLRSYSFVRWNISKVNDRR